MLMFKFGFNILGFVTIIIKEICLMLDALIYGLASYALRTFFEIAEISSNVSAYSTEINNILNRVMVLVGIYALFKLAFMIINYIIDPNKMNEMSKNGGQLVKNILIALILLITAPTIFKLLGDFQGMIVSQDVIPKIVYGLDKYDSGENMNLKDENQSARFVNNVFSLFFNPKDGVCESSLDNSKPYCLTYNSVLTGQKDIITLSAYIESYFDYMPVVSGIVGIMLVYYFIMFAIELGVRMIKLIVLQVISPIPIIMSVDPSQKNRLSDFVKVYTGLYLQIFIRILTFYLAFVVLGLISNANSLISTGNIITLETKINAIIYVLLVIGIFQAAKELPKLLEDAIGVKMGGSMPGKGFGAVLGGIIGGGVGLAGGAIAGGISGGIGGALAGAGTGLFKGVTGGAGAKNAGALISQSVANVKGAYGLGGKVAGAGGLGQYMLGGVENFFGAKGRNAATIAEYDNEISNTNKALEAKKKQLSQVQAQKERVGTLGDAERLRRNFENLAEQGFDNHGGRTNFIENDPDVLRMKAQLDEAWNNGDANAYQMGNPELERLKAVAGEKYDNLKNEHISNMLNHGSENPELIEALTTYNQYCLANGLSDRMIEVESDVSVVEQMSKYATEAQKEIQEITPTIKSEQSIISEINHIETELKNWEEKKKNFIDSRRRNEKRDEGPKYKSRDIYN